MGRQATFDGGAVSLALAAFLLLAGLAGDALAGACDAPGFPANDCRFNPWAAPLIRARQTPGAYDVAIHMGFLNTDYFCEITPENGVAFDTRDRRSPETDVTRRVLALLDGTDRLATCDIRYGVGDIPPEGIAALLPRAGAQIMEGRRHGRWGNPETHAKVLQIGQAAGPFITVHGSLNLQTVGLACKGNNALRFVEKTPTLYGYFRAFSDAAAVGSGIGLFPGGAGEVDSSGDALPAVVVGETLVRFYAGRGQAFVGGFAAVPERPWPLNLNAPTPGGHDPGVVDWYDAAIVDAARQLRQGRDVRLDVAVFEIGSTAYFVENIWRFVEEGFAGGRTEDRHNGECLNTSRPGNLTVRFLWQFQSGSASTATTALLAGPPAIRRVDPATGNAYTLLSARIWPRRDASGRAVNPGTPHDMHNKFMLLDVPGHEEERRIYVTSSNLDTPGQGSGKLWQAGTIVAARPGSGVWSGENVRGRNLFTAYAHYFERLWESREGAPGAGQLAFAEALSREHLAGEVNWIETVPHERPDAPPREGVDAFFFPVPHSLPEEAP